MRHLNTSKVILVGLVSGLMLALSANPAKAADIRIGIGFDLGHHHDYYKPYHHAPVISYRHYNHYAPVITYRHYDHHDRHYYKKHHNKHGKHYSKHDRYSGKYGHNRDYRHHDRYSGYRHHDRGTSIRHYRH